MSKNTAKSVSSAKTATVEVPETVEASIKSTFDRVVSGLSVPSVVSEIIDMYGKADKSDKATMRVTVENIRDARIESLDMIGAGSAKMTRDAMVSTPTSKKSEIDYNTVVAHRIVALRFAALDIMGGTTLPDGIESDMLDFEVIKDIVANFTERDVTDEMDKTVKSIANTKITRSGTRRNIQDVIDKAFEDAETGHFMTVADIRRKGATSDYTPSDGAIAAKLFPKSGSSKVSGVAPVDATASEPRGARKL